MISEQIGLDLLRTYVAVCRQGSLSRVAAQTGRTQSALSMQMRRLESLLEKQLFQRTGRGVVPTADGELFLDYATRIVALSDEALGRLRGSSMRGTVRIGLAKEVATTALSASLGRLHRAHPDIHLDVVVDDSMTLGQLWHDDRLDLMLATTSAIDDDALATWTVELSWVCALDYAIAEAQPLNVVATATSCAWRRRMLEALAASGREYRVVFTSQSITALQAAIEHGLGVGVLPAQSIRASSMRTLKTTAPAPLPVQYGIYARDRRAPVADAAIEALLDAIPEAARPARAQPHI